MQVTISVPDPHTNEAIDCHRMEFSYPALKKHRNASRP